MNENDLIKKIRNRIQELDNFYRGLEVIAPHTSYNELERAADKIYYLKILDENYKSDILVNEQLREDEIKSKLIHILSGV